MTGPTLRKLGDELLRLTQAFGWISRNGHDIILWRGNPREIFGRPLPERLCFDDILPVFSRPDRAALRQAIIGCLRDGRPWELELRITAASDASWLHASGTAIDIDGARHLTGVFRNVTREHHIRSALARETREKKLATAVLEQLLDVVPNAIAAYDPQDRLVFFNRQYRVYYDKAAPRIVIGETYDNILRFAVEQGQYMHVDPARAHSRKWMNERLARHKRGMKKDLVQQLSSGRWVQVRERKSPSGHTVFVSTDISDLIKAERRIRQQAETDPLTSLLNRNSFMRELGNHLRHRCRESACGCFILIDLDHFKSVNDSMGHQTGDALLVAMARRLKRATRPTDLCARLGGDEFAIFLPGVNEKNHETVATKIQRRLTAPLSLPGVRITPRVSMGVTLLTSKNESAGEIVRRADAALFQAKRDGRNTWRDYDINLQRRRERRHEIISGLRQAIASHSMDLALQPQIHLASGEHAGFEALARWTHEDTPISPAEFIPVAESTGMIMELGLMVAERSFAWFHDMKRRGLAPGRLAINISPVQLKCEKFLDSLRETLRKHDLEAGEVELEITETAIIGRDEALIERRLQELVAAGFQISLDDFGTGNATFAHLKRFPISRLKIDKSFIDDLGRKPESTIITLAIIHLAHNLGMDVIAEGIETAQQNSFLRINGCDMAQGYYHARPLSPRAARAWLAARQPPRPRAGA